MSEKGMAKSSIVIILLAIVAIVGVFAYMVLNKVEPAEYFKLVGNKSYDNKIIEEYRIFKKMAKDCGLAEEMSNAITFKRHVALDYFNEEYFNNKNVAVLVLYEDTSKNYIYSIDKVTYNEAGTEATIEYTYKTDGYAGTLGNTWYNYLLVELDKTVENVKFVKAAGSIEE